MKRGMVLSWLRLFAVQASWSYERMAAIGTARAMEPLLRDLPGGVGGDRYREALRRSVGFFNSHPYLIGVAVGAIAKAEHEGVPPPQIERLKAALTSSLGSMGDRLIWAGVLPCAVGIGLAFSTATRWYVGPLVFLLSYNVVHVALRTWGLQAGWYSGVQVARALGSPFLRTGLRVAGPAAALSVGLAIPLVATWLSTGVTPLLHTLIYGVAAVGVTLALWLIPSFGGLRFGLTMAAAALTAGLIWH
jgi:mannose/fructose/N-acetylgalactosamine-specific phosphotransferase system component IID